MKGTCSICGKEIRSHASSKHSAQANFLKAMGKHQWKQHRNTMISRIKAGKKASGDNPLLQDLLKSLGTGIQNSLRVFAKATKRARKKTVVMMDAIRPFLPPELQYEWDLLQALVGEDGGIMYYFKAK